MNIAITVTQKQLSELLLNIAVVRVRCVLLSCSRLNQEYHLCGVKALFY